MKRNGANASLGCNVFTDNVNDGEIKTDDSEVISNGMTFIPSLKNDSKLLKGTRQIYTETQAPFPQRIMQNALTWT